MIDGLKVLAVIPARGGSKGLPRKNVLPVAGRPLIAYTIDAARASRHVDRVILSSDDDEIIQCALANGCEVPFVRDASLATDEASSVDVVIDAIRRLPGYELVVLLQPTSPLRAADDIDRCLALLIARGAPACVTVRPAEDHPLWTFRLGPGDALEPWVSHQGNMPARRQELPPAWCLNGAVYVARCDWFLNERRFISDRTAAVQMPAERSIDIDTAQDLDRLRLFLEPQSGSR